jgi:methylated-DNA-[protein]-cysteine S-methyltransferase
VSDETATVAIDTALGTVGVVATGAGVRRVLLPGRTVLPAGEAYAEAGARAREAATQIEEYVAGERREFEIDLDLSDLEARHRKVLEALVAAAPFGHTLTYGELGRQAGEEDPREIGVMMARNPLPLVVPCHRVVAADGLGGFGGGLELKRRLLELEGVLPPRLLDD